jgi:hypothetical protein
MQRTGAHVYVALMLAIAAAMLSTEHPAQLYRQARSLLLTDGPAAASVADAIAEHPQVIVPP